MTHHRYAFFIFLFLALGQQLSHSILILALAGAKAALIGWDFMELRGSHNLWRFLYFGIILLFVSLLTTLILF